MGGTSSALRPVSGYLLLDKASGMTSNAALQRAKRLFAAKKAGHTGSLDPAATGMLPICFGDATKLSRYMLDADKTYRVTALLGVQTDTGDADGKIVAESDAPVVGAGELATVLSALVGDTLQTPPMYSALKHRGKRLYSLARRGIEVERQPRPITIHNIELEAIALPQLQFRVSCSKGTYVRTLVTDLAAKLGTLGHVTALRRLSVAPFGEDRALTTLDQLAALADAGDAAALDELLWPVDSVLEKWPRIDVDADDARSLRHGQCAQLQGAYPPGLRRVYSSDERFVGVGEVSESGSLIPRRIFL